MKLFFSAEELYGKKFFRFLTRNVPCETQSGLRVLDAWIIIWANWISGTVVLAKANLLLKNPIDM